MSKAKAKKSKGKIYYTSWCENRFEYPCKYNETTGIYDEDTNADKVFVEYVSITNGENSYCRGNINREFVIPDDENVRIRVGFTADGDIGKGMPTAPLTECLHYLEIEHAFEEILEADDKFVCSECGFCEETQSHRDESDIDVYWWVETWTK